MSMIPGCHEKVFKFTVDKGKKLQIIKAEVLSKSFNSGAQYEVNGNIGPF